MRFERRPSPPLRQVVARNAALAPVPVCVFVAGALVIKAEDSRHQRPSSPAVAAAEVTWCVQVLRSPKEAFAAAMQSWRERCEKCVCLQGDYVEK